MTPLQRDHLERLIRVTQKWIDGNYPSKCRYPAHTRKADIERVRVWKEKLGLT